MASETHVTEKTHPDLKWVASPPGFSIPHEMYQSDAFTVLTKAEIIVLIWVLSRRKYPSKRQLRHRKAKFNVWRFENKDSVQLPYAAFCDYFSKQQKSKRKPLAERTFYRALNKLMEVGFISLVRLGGNGVGDISTYRYEYNWRTWREGDKPCFAKKGRSRNNAFGRNGNGEFVSR